MDSNKIDESPNPTHPRWILQAHAKRQRPSFTKDDFIELGETLGWDVYEDILEFWRNGLSDDEDRRVQGLLFYNELANALNVQAGREMLNDQSTDEEDEVFFDELPVVKSETLPTRVEKTLSIEDLQKGGVVRREVVDKRRDQIPPEMLDEILRNPSNDVSVRFAAARWLVAKVQSKTWSDEEWRIFTDCFACLPTIVHDVLDALYNDPTSTVFDLAATIGVSERTIRRYRKRGSEMLRQELSKHGITI